MYLFPLLSPGLIYIMFGIFKHKILLIHHYSFLVITDIEHDIDDDVTTFGYYHKDGYPLPENSAIEGSFHCPRCSRVFRTKGGMLRHHRIECVDAPRFKCPHCDMKSKYTQAIYRHVRSRHKGRDAGFITLF